MNRITVVVENTALRDGLISEHGLSLWVETDSGVLLYDTGAGGGLLPNLKKLGLDPLAINCVVLSHGHRDHTGGLAALAALRKRAGLFTHVWCHADVFASHLREEENGMLFDVGTPLRDRAEYEKLLVKFYLVDGWANPLEGVTILAPIARKTDFEGPAPALVVLDANGKVIPDPLWDDLAVVLPAGDDIAVITGCAHSGAVNVLLAAEEHTGKKPVLLLGGTHLGPAPKAQQEKALAELAGRKELKVAAGHCTGAGFVKVLADKLGERALGLSGGQVFEF